MLLQCGEAQILLSKNGSGGYSRSVAGGTVSGTLSESGADDSSYHYAVDYILGCSGDWQTVSGSGGTSGTNEVHRSYSGSGSYSRTDASTYAVYGTVYENANDDWVLTFATTSTMASDGVWSTSGTASDIASGTRARLTK